jgi:hypothetical protein
MRRFTLCLILTIAISAPLTIGNAQTAPDSIKTRKSPSKVEKIAKRVADTAATTAAGAGVQSVLGKKAGGVANALGAGGINPCGPAYGVTAGAAIVGAAKGIVKEATDSADGVNPCAKAGTVPGMPGGIPGLAGGADAAAAAMAEAMTGAAGGGAAAGANPLSGMGAVAAMTPMGMAAGAAPGAIKGVKGLLGGKPQDKTAMLRELGRGKLELKQVKFIEGTQEFEPGFEDSFTAFAEAIALVEGTYYLHVSAESPREKGAEPDTALAHKRLTKVWALMAASGVSDEKVIAVSELPASMSAGRKLPKPGDVKVEIIKFEKQP